MKLLIYTRRGNGAWWRFMAGHLRTFKTVETVSELRGETGYSLAPQFYKALKGRGNDSLASNYFNPSELNDIIARCRLLRSLDRSVSLRMIGAMASAIGGVISQFRPDVFLTTRVDSYVLDIFDRLLAARGIPYAGIWRAALFPEKCFFTVRGEPNLIRNVTQNEVEAGLLAVLADNFEATSIRGGGSKGLFAFAKKRSYYAVRDRVLNLQRHVLSDPLGYRYLTSGLHVPEYSVSFSDWRTVRFGQRDWRSLVAPFPTAKRVFVALQVNPESTIDYYVKNVELIDCEKVLTRLVSSLTAAGYVVCVKDHPNMFAMRPVRFFDSIAGSGNVVFVPYDVSSSELIECCGVTFTWTGTVGIQSSLKGRKAIVTNPTYFDPRAHIRLESIHDIDLLPTKISSFEVDTDLSSVSYEAIERVLRGCFSGSIDWAGFNVDSTRAKAGAVALAQSLDEYVPIFSSIHNAKS